MNIIVISTVSREDLLIQTINSLWNNADHRLSHTLTLVLDSPEKTTQSFPHTDDNAFITTIINGPRRGASDSRNIGASSIPTYSRQEWVMFCDDDIYAAPQWDLLIEKCLSLLPKRNVISGHAHPFNHHDRRLDHAYCYQAHVLSTVHMVMPWHIWDDVGYWALPGGPGGSEDVDWCRRAVGKGYGLAVTDPQCMIHCGLRSSTGKPIVGHGLMLEQNTNLIRQYRLDGKVIMSL